MEKFTIQLEDGRLLVTFKKELFEKEAVFASAYKFTDKCIIKIEPLNNDAFGVYFKMKKEDNNFDLKETAELFCNEAIDQQLRLDIEKKYGNVRELIVKQAFSPIKNLDEEINLLGKDLVVIMEREM